MKSHSNKTMDPATPQDVMNEIVINLGSLTMQLKEEIDSAHCPSSETLSEIHSLVGELIWLSGGIHMAEFLTSQAKSPEEVLN